MAKFRGVYAGQTIAGIVCTFVLCISVMDASGEASNQCDQDGLTNTEQVICDTPQLSFLDRELSNLLLSLEHHDVHAQEAWLNNRNGCGTEQYCILRSYASRIRAVEKELNYRVTDLDGSLIVRDPLLAFVFGKGEGYSIPFQCIRFLSVREKILF